MIRSKGTTMAETAQKKNKPSHWDGRAILPSPAWGRKAACLLRITMVIQGLIISRTCCQILVYTHWGLLHAYMSYQFSTPKPARILLGWIGHDITLTTLDNLAAVIRKFSFARALMAFATRAMLSICCLVLSLPLPSLPPWASAEIHIMPLTPRMRSTPALSWESMCKRAHEPMLQFLLVRSPRDGKCKTKNPSNSKPSSIQVKELHSLSQNLIHQIFFWRVCLKGLRGTHADSPASGRVQKCFLWRGTRLEETLTSWPASSCRTSLITLC